MHTLHGCSFYYTCTITTKAWVPIDQARSSWKLRVVSRAMLAWGCANGLWPRDCLRYASCTATCIQAGLYKTPSKTIPNHSEPFWAYEPFWTFWNVRNGMLNFDKKSYVKCFKKLIYLTLIIMMQRDPINRCSQHLKHKKRIWRPRLLATFGWDTCPPLRLSC